MPNPNLPPGHVQVRPFPAIGSTRLENREGGNNPLWTFETAPGVYTSTWATFNKDVLRVIKSQGRKMVMTIVVDTNVPGCPSISVVMQPVEIVKDNA